MNTIGEYELEMISHACKGDAAAIDFVGRAWTYFHAADDLIDTPSGGALTRPEFTIKVMVMGQDLYCHPFFLRHAHALNAVIRNCISTYADTVAWEKSEDAAKRAWAEAARHCGLDVLFAVADICGGWEHRRKVSAEVRLYNLKSNEQEK